MISSAWIVPLEIVIMFDDPVEHFFLYNSLNPVTIPCLESTGGNCQEAVILVEELTVTEKFLGGFEGTEK